MSNTDYLRYSTESMKEYITQQLTENTNFTDQLFASSNISAVSDILSYMFDVLTYYLNVSASESMFTDAQLYENMNRIVKEINYKPDGFKTSMVECRFNTRDSQNPPSNGSTMLPKYTTYTTPITDSKGEPVKYTLIESVPMVVSNGVVNSDFTPMLYNGSWKLYPTKPTAAGIPFETIYLEELDISSQDKIFLAHNFIDVYVKSSDDTYTKYTNATNNNLYDSLGTDNHYELRLNENHKYTIKFGNGIFGRKLSEGDELYIVYLQSNGVEGQIGSNVINGDSNLELSINGLDTIFIKENFFKVAPGKTGGYRFDELDRINAVNNLISTGIVDIEDVDSIRENAPNWFRIGSRLITANDFRTHILKEYPMVYDCQVMNNWEYMTEFQQWLHQYKDGMGQSYLTLSIRHYGYEFTDSCDFNNIYIWMKKKTSDDSMGAGDFTLRHLDKSIKGKIINDIRPLKPLTSELVPLNPILVNFDFAADTGDANESKLVITRDKNSMVAVDAIKQSVKNVVLDFFKESNNTMGVAVDPSKLFDIIMDIEGVSEAQTVSVNTEDATEVVHDGISFVRWTDTIIDGADKEIVRGSMKLKRFQFPILFNPPDIESRLEVKTDQFGVYNIEY